MPVSDPRYSLLAELDHWSDWLGKGSPVSRPLRVISLRRRRPGYPTSLCFSRGAQADWLLWKCLEFLKLAYLGVGSDRWLSAAARGELRRGR